MCRVWFPSALSAHPPLRISWLECGILCILKHAQIAAVEWNRGATALGWVYAPPGARASSRVRRYPNREKRSFSSERDHAGALREVELRSTQEEQENGALDSTKPLLRCLAFDETSGLKYISSL